jgi:hypothetical protein
VSWTDDSAIPVGHEDIVAVLEAIGTRSVADALLSFFELLEQTEVAWNSQFEGLFKESEGERPPREPRFELLLVGSHLGLRST